MRTNLFARTAVAVALATAGAVVPASSASAATNCFSGQICFFDGKDGTGTVKFFPASGNACINLTGFNDKTSYISNNSDSEWVVYRDVDCPTLGPLSKIHPRSNGNMNSTWDNRITSFIRWS